MSSIATPAPPVAVRADGFARRFMRNRLCVFGGCVTALVLLVAVYGLVLLAVPSLHDRYLGQSLVDSLNPPGHGSLLGTDSLGRSLAARVAVGTGISLGVGFAVTALSISVGGVMGLLAGFYGGWADRLISAVVDITWGFPVILVAVVLAGVLERGLAIVIFSVALINWAGFARIIRGEALTLREREFVKAARVLGVRDARILRRHLVPNMLAPTLVMASYYVAITIIAEAGLSFIGVGVQPPTPSLGVMISEGRSYWDQSIWVVAVPGVVLALLVIGLNALGDGLRDILDRRLEER